MSKILDDCTQYPGKHGYALIGDVLCDGTVVERIRAEERERCAELVREWTSQFMAPTPRTHQNVKELLRAIERGA